MVPARNFFVAAAVPPNPDLHASGNLPTYRSSRPVTNYRCNYEQNAYLSLRAMPSNSKESDEREIDNRSRIVGSAGLHRYGGHTLPANPAGAARAQCQPA